MNRTLFGKLLRDVRWPLLSVCLLLLLYQMLWARITERITREVLPQLFQYIPRWLLEKVLFEGPGKMVQTLMGGETIRLDVGLDMLTIGYVHPLVLTVFCVWAIGRSAGAVAGELDRGTMELLLAQPVPRRHVILTHLAVDLVTIPVLCLSLLTGTWVGLQFVDLGSAVPLDRFAAALANAAAFVFAVSGFTVALSALGRSRWRVLSVALGVLLVMFLFNFLGQLWDTLEPARPLTLFYYYQPQAIILQGNWYVPLGRGLGEGGKALGHAHVLAVPLLVGAGGYGLALRVFTRRDLPAPL